MEMTCPASVKMGKVDVALQMNSVPQINYAYQRLDRLDSLVAHV